jgi:tetratricopeptide (TPR) repeat protein
MNDTAARIPGKGSGRRWRLGLTGAVLLAALVAAGFGLARRPREPEPPGIDPGRVDPAVGRTIERSRAEVVRSPHSGEAWGKLGMKFLGHHFFAEAVACLARAEQLDPGEARWPYLQALAVRRTDPDAAIVKLRRAVEVCGDSPPVARLMLAELLLQRGHLEEAEAHFGRALAHDPEGGRAQLGLGQVAYERDALSDALGHGRRAAADPRTAKAANVFLAEVYQRLGDRAAAEQALLRSRSLPDDPRPPDPYADEVVALQVGLHAGLARGFELLRQDRVPEALRLIQQTANDYPESAPAWLLLGRILVRARNLPAAEQALRLALERDPDAAEVEFYLGVVSFLRKDSKAAAPHFRRATELKPDYALAHYNLGQCLLQRGDRAGAVAACRAALHCQPDLADAHVSLGELLAQQGRRDEATAHLRQALALRPADARARQLLEQVQKRD